MTYLFRRIGRRKLLERFPEQFAIIAGRLALGARLLCRTQRGGRRIVTLFGPCAAETMLINEVKLKILPVRQTRIAQRVWTDERPTLSFEVGVDVLPKRVVAAP